MSDAATGQFAWSGAGLVATVSGTTIAVELKTLGSSDPVYFQPVIDGTPGARFAVPNGDQTVTLASNLADGDHTVELYRDTEGRYGTSTFEGFTQGTLKAPPVGPGRLIEVVGDSISAGYGDLGSEQHPNFGPDPDGGCLFSTLTESAYQTYGATAARTLGADPSLIAVSGWGMYRDNNDNMSDVLSSVYPNELGLLANPPWPFVPAPQAVVINLGTNDFALGDPGQTEFEERLHRFSRRRARQVSRRIHLLHRGPAAFRNGARLGADVHPRCRLHRAKRRRHEGSVLGLRAKRTRGLGTGCQYHPNVTEHQAMAATLVAALRTALGW